MSVYANKFRLEIGDVARLIFSDERGPIIPDGVKPAAIVAEVVLTVDNLRALNKVITDLLKEPKP